MVEFPTQKKATHDLLFLTTQILQCSQDPATSSWPSLREVLKCGLAERLDDFWFRDEIFYTILGLVRVFFLRNIPMFHGFRERAS
jgi:hypothetical protein